MRKKVINKQLLLNKIAARQEEEIDELFVKMMFVLYGRTDDTIPDYNEGEENKCDTNSQDQTTQTI